MQGACRGHACRHRGMGMLTASTLTASMLTACMMLGCSAGSADLYLQIASRKRQVPFPLIHPRKEGEAAAAAMHEQAAAHQRVQTRQPAPTVSPASMPTEWSQMHPSLTPQPTFMPDDAEYFHPAFLAAMSTQPQLGEGGEAAAEALLMLGEQGGWGANAAASQRAGVPAQQRPAPSRRGQHGTVTISVGGLDYTLHKHGSSRRAGLFIQNNAGIKRLMPAYQPVNTPAEAALHLELLDTCTTGGRVDWVMMKQLWNQRFVQQVFSDAPVSPGQQLYPKGKKELRAFYANLDRLQRSKRNRQYSLALLALAARQQGGQQQQQQPTIMVMPAAGLLPRQIRPPQYPPESALLKAFIAKGISQQQQQQQQQQLLQGQGQGAGPPSTSGAQQQQQGQGQGQGAGPLSTSGAQQQQGQGQGQGAGPLSTSRAQQQQGQGQGQGAGPLSTSGAQQQQGQGQQAGPSTSGAQQLQGQRVGIWAAFMRRQAAPTPPSGAMASAPAIASTSAPAIASTSAPAMGVARRAREEDPDPGPPAKKGRYLCTKCAKYGKVARYKGDGHSSTCPHKHEKAITKGKDGRNFNAKQYLASKGKPSVPC